MGNYFIDVTPTLNSNNTTYKVLYVDNIYPPTGTGTYQVLKRDGTDFQLIQQAGKPIRIDISNASPILTVQDLETLSNQTLCMKVL